MTRLLVVMGSGETAPTMVKPHRALFARVAGPALVLDTPYGFQSNADDISGRAVTYFAASVGHAVSVLSWRRPPPDALTRERAVAALRDAGWVFAGPGSPTYALRQWHDTPVPGLLADKLARGGVVVFASAAALTLGTHTVPVYEIYKAGVEPRWETGLNLVEAALGFPAVVIPHYDNAEGGHNDTRFCYLGEDRLAAMEAMLPPERSLIIGVDEHTAVLFELDARTASVVGNGCLTCGGRAAARPSRRVRG
jgi:cyanophycinase-like exopeptidase